MVIARKIAYNVVVSSASKILSTILALVSIGLITRYLGVSGFGNYATVLAFLSFFSAIADLGLYSTATREISRPKAQEKEIIGNIFSLRILISLAVVLISPLVVLFFPYPSEVKLAIVIVAASFLFSSTYQILNGVFQKNLAMDKVAIAEFLGKVLQVAFIFWAIKTHLSFSWIISSLLFSMVFTFFLVFLFSKKYIKFNLGWDFSYWKKFIKVSYPLGIAAVIGFIYFKIDTILLSVMKTSAEVGIYNVAYKVIENITFFPAMMVGLVFPIMSHSIFSNRERFEDISNKIYKVFWIFVVPLLIGALFLADGITRLIGGNGFSGSAAALRILIFALGCIFFSNFSNSVLISGNLQKKLMIIICIAAAFNVVANLIFIPYFSYMAAAIVSVATEFFVTVATFWVMAKDLSYFPSAENFWRILAAGAVMAAYLFIFRNSNFILLAISGAVIYFTALWAFRGVRTEEITSIISKKGIEEYEPH